MEKSRPSVQKKKSYKNIFLKTIFYPESPVPLNLKFALDSTNFNKPYWAAAHSSFSWLNTRFWRILKWSFSPHYYVGHSPFCTSNRCRDWYRSVWGSEGGGFSELLLTCWGYFPENRPLCSTALPAQPSWLQSNSAGRCSGSLWSEEQHYKTKIRGKWNVKD